MYIKLISLKLKNFLNVKSLIIMNNIINNEQYNIPLIYCNDHSDDE